MDDHHGSETAVLIDRLRAYLDGKGHQDPTRSSPSRQVESFEALHLVRLPPDLRCYYATIDGMEEGELTPMCSPFPSTQGGQGCPEELAYFGGIPKT